MRRTLFGKLFLYNAVIVVLSMGLMAVLLYGQLGAYFKTEVYNNLEKEAYRVSQTGGKLMDLSNRMGQDTFFKEIMGAMGTEKGQGFLIVNRSGAILVSSGFEENIETKRINTEDISPVFRGKIIKANSDMSGIFSQKLLHVAVPVKTSKGIEAAAVLCNTTAYGKEMQIGVMKLFCIIMLSVVIVSLVVSAILSRRISKPIKEMTQVAKRIASGDFTKRVSSDAEGEIAILTKSFNQMSAALEEMDDVQSSFISDVSHELRTPMTIISGFVDGILDETIPPCEHKKYLEIVSSEVKRLSRLVNDLLEMSRLNSGKIEYKMLPFDINENVRKAVISFEQAISDKNIEVDVQFEEDSTYVMGNSDSIYRVITNLMDNAVKFTPEGGEIKICVKKNSSKGIVSVENTGKGLNEKELSHIWDRFYQTDKSRSSEKKGVGLGLYIVKNIMKAHSNEIYAQSEEGQWTRFTFELDAVKQNKAIQ